MVQVVSIMVYYRVMDENETQLYPPQKPTSQDIDDIKLDIARLVKEVVNLPKKIEYYYVVLKTKAAKSYVDKRGTKGRYGYRTVVPKIML